MSKLTKARLSQGKKKFEDIIAVELPIKKSLSIPAPVGCDEWEIYFEMNNITGFQDAWEKDSKFELYIEYLAKENDKLLVETICGNVEIVEIAPSRLMGGPYSIKAFSKVLKFSSKEKFIKEKVQFD